MRVNIHRGKAIESQHTIHAVVINSQQKIIFSCGNPAHITCIRSSFKPFQAYPFIHYGGHLKYKFTNSEIALLCASHNGEPRHVTAVKNMLNKVNSSHQKLECGLHLPKHPQTKKKILKNKLRLNSLYNNCSGKHVGMLALSKLLKANTTNYINPNHIVQKSIMDFLNKNHTCTPHSTGIDGCGAVAPFFKIKEIAKLYLEFGTSANPAYRTLYTAMTKHPYMIAGQKRFDSFFTKLMHGTGLCKGGGEGVLGLYFKNAQHGHLALALKVEDGNHRARSIAATNILKHIQGLSKAKQSKLDQFIQSHRFNHNNRKIGFISTEISKLH